MNYLLDKNYFYSMKLYKSLLYMCVILNTLYLLPGYESIWLDHELLPLNWDSYSILPIPIQTKFLLFTIIIIQILFSTLALFQILPVVSQAFVFITTLTLNQASQIVLDGGNNLFILLIFFSIFINNNDKNKKSNRLSNTFYFLSRYQLCLLYLTAGITKLTGKYWVNGTGIFYALLSENFSHPLLIDFVVDYAEITVFLNYITLIYQISFPFLIWFEKFRKPYIVLGFFIHLSIGIGMGLLFFGIVMIVGHSLFYSNKECKNIFNKIHKFTDLVKVLYANKSRING